VLTGLIARGGYWTGEATQIKEDYNTYENTRLIQLNQALFAAAEYTGNYMTEFSPELVRRMSSIYGEIDDAPYRAFVEQCNEHSPWIWKDPRLWVTIHFWKKLLDLDQCRFLLLTRSLPQCWISGLLRRQIRTYRGSRRYEVSVQNSIRLFFRESGVQALELSYEELIANPEETIERLNRFLGAELTVADLKSIYRKPLYKAPKSSFINTVKALLIYAKNYSERVDRPSRQSAAAPGIEIAASQSGTSRGQS
jgi:hypothetical protein